LFFHLWEAKFFGDLMRLPQRPNETTTALAFYPIPNPNPVGMLALTLMLCM